MPKRLHRISLYTVFILILSGCASNAGSPSPTATALLPTNTAAPVFTATTVATTPTSPPQPTSPPDTPAPPTATAITGPSYDNPVYNRDFPDPSILRVGDTYYGYSTNTSTSHIPAIRSTDLAHWEWLGEVLPGLPGWVQLNNPRIWAPGAIQIDDTFVLYFAAQDKKSGRQCISRAVSSSPEGLFKDDSTAPFICQLDLGGSIDPYPFLDNDGKLYLYWKNDGNCCGKEVALWVQPLSDDGLSLEGEPTKLLIRDQRWERPLIENPAMVFDGSQYYLFYSGNWWESLYYAVGYAVCETATGPCKKPKEEPIFQYTKKVMGPGGEAFFTEPDGDIWMAYHAWTPPDVGYPSGFRSLRIEPVKFVDGVPVIQGPTDDPQPIP